MMFGRCAGGGRSPSLDRAPADGGGGGACQVWSPCSSQTWVLGLWLGQQPQFLDKLKRLESFCSTSTELFTLGASAHGYHGTCSRSKPNHQT
eukprot:2993922-Rhodomonas_salina.1